jgi:hypothetical protein
VKKFILYVAGISLMLASPVHSFFLGSDKYTKKLYYQAGIIWEHNRIFPDKYTFDGKEISQTDAEKFTNQWRKMEDISGLKDRKILKILYLNAMNFALEFRKKEKDETEKCNAKCRSLEIENARLRFEIAAIKSRPAENNRSHNKNDANVIDS